MRPEGNQHIANKTAWITGGAFAIALVHQIAAAPNALADNMTHGPAAVDSTATHHEGHVGDPLDTYTNGDQPAHVAAATETSSATSSAAANSSAEGRAHTDSPPQTRYNQTDTGFFDLPAPKAKTPVATVSTAPPAAASTETAASTPQPASVQTQNKSDQKAESTQETVPTPSVPAPTSSPLSRPESSDSSSSTPSSATVGAVPSSSTANTHKPRDKANGNQPSSHVTPTTTQTSVPAPHNTSIFDLPVPGKPSTPPTASAAAAPASPAHGVYPNTETNFSQHDPTWKDVPYGATGDIDADGCGPTAMADIVDTLTGKKLTPVDTAAYLKAHNGVTNDGATKWAELAQAYTDEGLQHTEYYKSAPYADESGFINLDILKQILARGGMVEINGRDPHGPDPNTPATTGGHFIAIRGVTPDGQILVSDPNSTANGVKPFAPELIFGPATYAIAVYPPAPPVHEQPPQPSTPAPAPATASTAQPEHQTPAAKTTNTGIFDLPVPAHASQANLTDTGLFSLPMPGKTTPAAVPAPAPAPAPSPEQSNQQQPLNEQQMAIIKSLGLSPAHEKYLVDRMTAALNMRREGYKENPQAMVAQDIVESGWGESELSAKYYNDFGMKAPKGTPPGNYVVMGTWEYDANGQKYWVPDAHFLSFGSVEDELKGYDKFIQDRSWFADALQYTNDPAGFIHAFMNTDHGQMAWATDPSYFTTLMKEINSLRLNDIAAAGN